MKLPGNLEVIIKRMNLIRAWNDNPEVADLLDQALALIIKDIERMRKRKITHCKHCGQNLDLCHCDVNPY